MNFHLLLPILLVIGCASPFARALRLQPRSLQPDMGCEYNLTRFRGGNWSTIDTACFHCASTSISASKKPTGLSVVHCDFVSYAASARWDRCETNATKSFKDLDGPWVSDLDTLGDAALMTRVRNISSLGLNASWGIAQGCDDEHGVFVYLFGKSVNYGAHDRMPYLLSYKPLEELRNGEVLNGTVYLAGGGRSWIEEPTEENPEPCPTGGQWSVSVIGTCKLLERENIDKLLGGEEGKRPSQSTILEEDAEVSSSYGSSSSPGLFMSLLVGLWCF